jgi:2-C-methyl-D-erythritol 2,4-cyclodiphosphate synthase
MYRVGHGVDLHRFSPDRKLILGGVTIPFEKGLLGHSDADVVVHALMDALLGARGLPDIGHFFPPQDAKWKDASSMALLEIVIDQVCAGGWAVVNADITLVAEAPKISPYSEQIKNNLAKALKINENSVSIKATTAEGMGMIGKGEGMYCSATVLVEKKD